MFLTLVEHLQPSLSIFCHPTALTQKIQQVINADDVDFDVDAEEVYFIHLIKNIALGPFFLWKC